MKIKDLILELKKYDENLTILLTKKDQTITVGFLDEEKQELISAFKLQIPEIDEDRLK